VNLTRAVRLDASRSNGGDDERGGNEGSLSHGAYYNPVIRKALFIIAFVASACGPTTPPAPPASPVPPAVSALGQSIDAILADPGLARGYWGVVVRSLKTGDVLYDVNGAKLMLPASNMKIVTLAAAAEKLGWNYTFTTSLQASGTIANGTLAGDLVAVGSGDPSLAYADGMADRVFADWATQLKTAGIRTIAGRVVGLDNPVDTPEWGDGWMWDDLVEEDSAGIGPLQLNEDAVRMTVAAGPAIGASGAVSLAPFAAALTIDSHVTTAAAGSEPSLHLRRLPGASTLDVRGTIPLGHAPISLGVSVADPTQFFVDALRAALIRNGIDVREPAVVRQSRTPNPESRVTTLVDYKSPPLSTLAMRLMKISQNQYAETLFRTVGGRAAVLQTLEPWGIAPADLIQRDGSGLSRYDLVTPNTLVTILMHIANNPTLLPPFEASLPVAGDLGLTNRMKGTAAEGNARAKTGSMTAVRALAGYVTSTDGERLVFSIIANNFDVAPAAVNAATDAIVVKLAEFRRSGGPATRAPRGSDPTRPSPVRQSNQTSRP